MKRDKKISDKDRKIKKNLKVNLDENSEEGLEENSTENEKKRSIVLPIIILIVGFAVGAFFYTNKSDGANVINKYYDFLRNKEYDKMYDLVDTSLSKDEFTSRVKNIYEGIEIQDIKINIIGNTYIENQNILDESNNVNYYENNNTLIIEKNGDNSVNQVIQENLVAIRVVKAFVRQPYEKQKFKTANDEFTQAGLNAVMKMLLMAPALMIGVNVATVLILYNGGNMVLRGELEVGQLSSIITYIFNILFSVMMVGMALLQLTRARACADRIFEVLDTEPSIEDGKSAAEPADVKGLVEFRNVSFKYQAAGTGDDVLRNISFTAKPGQTVAIVGGTGVGKSTLVNLIPRFYDVTGGEILLDGRDVRDYALDDLRGRIGMVLQNNVLFSGTIRENLLWGNPDATEEEIIQAAKDAQAYDFIMSFPDGLDTHIDQGGVNVSGGQKQRLCIARAMLRRPEVLILDDSTSAVDSTTEALIRQSFHDNLKDTTVLLIAQRISSVRDADRIIVLEDDTISAMGTHDELMETSSVYQEIYYSQQEGVKDNG